MCSEGGPPEETGKDLIHSIRTVYEGTCMVRQEGNETVSSGESARHQEGMKCSGVTSGF